MNVADFDYNLTEDKIAKYPPTVRGNSRLLTLDRDTGIMQDMKYQDLADLLQSGDVLLLNDTKVLKARLYATNSAGKSIELVMLEKHTTENETFLNGKYEFKALYRGKITIGELLQIDETKNVEVIEIADGGIVTLRSETSPLSLAEIAGHTPIPPYLKRPDEQSDSERYQTVFAQNVGSVAAPTASLNFTEELRAKLEAKGVLIHTLTLHVGLGTFLPVRSDNVEEHHMHSEYYIVPQETIQAVHSAKQQGKRVIALGTTVTRAIESAAARGEFEIANKELVGETTIFIYPGYQFRVIDALVTNFHAPRSTVLLLAAAFAGEDHLRNAYTHALDHDYRFLSYGDSMFVY